MCPWRCVCVCELWLLSTCSLMCSVLLQFNRFCINSLLSLCQSITSIHSAMLLFLFIHFFSSALFHNFISSSHSRGTVPRLLFCSVIHCSTHLFESFFFTLSTSPSLISLSLFHIVLQSYQTGLTYIHSCRRDPFQKRLLLPRQQIFSLQILQHI